jgi:hypothetical protein
MTSGGRIIAGTIGLAQAESSGFTLAPNATAGRERRPGRHEPRVRRTLFASALAGSCRPPGPPAGADLCDGQPAGRAWLTWGPGR